MWLWCVLQLSFNYHYLCVWIIVDWFPNFSNNSNPFFLMFFLIIPNSSHSSWALFQCIYKRCYNLSFIKYLHVSLYYEILRLDLFFLYYVPSTWLCILWVTNKNLLILTLFLILLDFSLFQETLSNLGFRDTILKIVS